MILLRLSLSIPNPNRTEVSNEGSVRQSEHAMVDRYVFNHDDRCHRQLERQLLELDHRLTRRLLKADDSHRLLGKPSDYPHVIYSA